MRCSGENGRTMARISRGFRGRMTGGADDSRLLPATLDLLAKDIRAFFGPLR